MNIVIELDQVGAARQQAVARHPHQMRRELVSHLGPVARGGDHVAAGDVDLVGERDGDRIARFRGIDRPGSGDDAFDFRGLPGRQNRNGIADADMAAGHRAGKAAEVGVGPVDPLHGHAERLGAAVFLDIHAFEIGEQMRP
jgi:hypothetical protein